MSEEIHEPWAVPEFWCDGATDHYVTSNVMKFTYFSLQKIPGLSGIHRVAILKIAQPIAGLDASRRCMERVIQWNNVERQLH